MSSAPAHPPSLSRDELALRYLEQLPFAPYPVQEQALYAWFGSDEGVLVCTPTGTGKTLIAEAAAFEALHTGSTIYYTTPLIALTEQKFHEMQAAAVRWGFHPEDVGLVTGNRRVNPEAKVLVVVAEILLNRLLQPHVAESLRNSIPVAERPGDISAVVMDEFHSFADPERGIVWEFTLSLLPKSAKLLLLSATVGNAIEFLGWLRSAHQRNLELVQSAERKVPLLFQWVPDKLLNEHLEEMAAGDADTRRTPALLFCFSRDECWSIAEELKGKSMLSEGQQKQLVAKLAHHDWTQGAGPKLKQVLMRGVGVHHAGLLPKYRRIVEDLFQHKLLSVCVCTETLSAGINLPARSIVLPSLIKGPPGKKKVIEASSAHQIFGRAGRPQFDKQGYVYALPHEDDVRILRWKEKYDQIPEDTRDINLLKAKKALKKKQPVRSPNRQYWNEAQFEKLRTAPPRHLASQGPLPWRMLAYMLQLSPEVERLRRLVRKRLMEPKQLALAEQHLHHMLRILHTAGVVRLEPEPPPTISPPFPRGGGGGSSGDAHTTGAAQEGVAGEKPGISENAGLLNAGFQSAVPSPPPKRSAFAQLMLEALQKQHEATGTGPIPVDFAPQASAVEYRPEMAYPTARMNEFFVFRSVNPLYALFLVEQFAIADEVERLQALESVLELPRSLIRAVRVPNPDRMPPGPLARNYVDTELISRGLIAAGDLYPPWDPDIPFEERKYAPALGEKLRLLFEAEYPNVHGVFVQPVWAAGDLLQFGCDFQNYVTGRQLQKQEGLIFRHLLRLILLLGEFSQVTPPGVDPTLWRSQLRTLADQFTACCHTVDPHSTEYMLAHAADQDIVVVQEPPAVIEAATPVVVATPTAEPPPDDTFGEGVLDSE